MTVIDANNKTKNETEGVPAKVMLKASWTAFPAVSTGPRQKFDPRAAGRRAVARHGEALRRLST